MSERSFDKPFFAISLILILCGFFIFTSASLGLLAREGARLSSVAFNQLFFGLVLGFIAMYVAYRIPFKFWQKYSFYIYLATIFLTVLVFVPGIGFEHGGAKRWIHIGSYTFQPAELLKIGFIIYFASWLSGIRDKISSYKFGLIPLIIILVINGSLLLLQPDTDTFAVMAMSGIVMYIAAGARIRDLFILLMIGIIGFGALAYSRPYIMKRLETYINPASDPRGASYQIQQSLIAIGSGEVTGRGFGQSIQKFDYLPEPIGDSIFAVASEEFGFIGASLLILLFVLFGIQGFRISQNTSDTFGKLAIIGIVMLIVIQSFVNMSSMLGILPLSGIPLPFVSHGGTALLVSLFSIGIILNISKYKKSE